MSSRNRGYHFYKSVPFTQKRPRMEDCSIHTNFIEDGFEEIEMNFRLEYSARKNRATLPDVPLLPEIFRWNEPKSRVHAQCSFRFVINNQFLTVAVTRECMRTAKIGLYPRLVFPLLSNRIFRKRFVHGKQATTLNVTFHRRLKYSTTNFSFSS